MNQNIVFLAFIILALNNPLNAQGILDFTIYTKEGKVISGKFRENKDLYPYAIFEYNDSSGVKQRLSSAKTLYARVGNLKFETRNGYSDYLNLIIEEGQIKVLYRVQMANPKDTMLLLQNSIIDQPDLSKAYYSLIKHDELMNLFVEYPELYARYKNRRTNFWLDDIRDFNIYVDTKERD